MNCAVPGLSSTGSGTGPAGVGCIAGATTWNWATNGVPLIKMARPLIVCSVLLAGVSVTVSVPIPGVTKGGEM